MDARGITDEKSLRAWLEDQPRETAVIIVLRAAVRVAPAYWRSVEPCAHVPSPTGLPICRALLTCSAWTKRPSAQIRSTVTVVAGIAARTAAAVAAATDETAFAALAAVTARTATDLANADVRTTASAASVAAATVAADAATADAERRHFIDRTTRDAAVAAARAAARDAVRHDAVSQLRGGDALAAALWPDGDNPLADAWANTAEGWRNAGPDWDFWCRWYQAALDGQPLHGEWETHWDLLERIALIDPATWDAGPAAVAEDIRRIERDLAKDLQGDEEALSGTAVERALNTAILKAALTDFTVDQIARLMRMVPFAEDSRHLTGAELEEFLAEARAAVHRLNALRNLLHAGASPDSYELAFASVADSLADYLGNAEQVSELNIGLFVDLCSSLEFYYLSEDCVLSLGAKSRFLGAAVAALQQLVRDHFAPTLLRTRPLKDLALTEDDDSASLIGDLRRALDQVRSANAGHVLPLDAEGRAALDHQMDELRRLQLAYSTTFDPGLRDQRRKDLGVKSAAFTVTLVRWQLIAQAATGSVWKGGKWIAETWDGAQNLRGAVDALLRLIGMK